VPSFEVGSSKNVKYDVIMYYGPEQMDVFYVRNSKKHDALKTPCQLDIGIVFLSVQKIVPCL
jgi:hypothetical protein